MYSNKAISPVVATSLLIVVVVIAVVGFQSWFNIFSDSMFNNIESQSQIGFNEIKVEGIIGEKLYLNIRESENLDLNLLKIINDSGSVMCEFNDVDRNGLVGYWNFDEENGNVAKDLSGNDLDGNISHNNMRTSSGKFGNALNFKGMYSGDRVDLGNSSVLNPQKFTITAWIKSDYYTEYAYNYIYSNSRDCCGSYNGIGFRIDRKKIKGKIWNNTSIGVESSNINNIKEGEWAFLVFSYNGSQMRIYLDGEIITSKNSNLKVGNPATYNSYIGAMGNLPDSHIFNGTLDEISLWNRTLGLEEIKQLYRHQLIKSSGVNDMDVSSCNLVKDEVYSIFGVFESGKIEVEIIAK